MTKKMFNLKEKFKSIRISQIILLACVLVLVLVIFLINVIRDMITGNMYDQHAGQRWSEDARCGQVSMFFGETLGVNTDKITEYEYAINKGLIADGYQEADASLQGGNAVWTDCYSALGSIEVTHDKRTVNSVAVGVGGDFFEFHPMQIISGNYFSSDTVMKDYVVLDEDLAWQLFGSNDIIGESVTLNGVPHYVTGVVKRDSGKYVRAAGLNFPTIYCSYESLAAYGNIDSSVLATDGSLGSMQEKKSDEDEAGNGTTDYNSEAKGIICMEVVMPNPVENYAKNFLISKLSLNTNVVEVVDNTIRFENKHIFDVIMKFHLRGMQLKPLIYPYWENNARAHENIIAVFLLIQVVCAVIAFILLSVFTVQAYRHRRWRVGDLWQRFLDWKYDIESGVKKHNAKWKYF